VEISTHSSFVAVTKQIRVSREIKLWFIIPPLTLTLLPPFLSTFSLVMLGSHFTLTAGSSVIFTTFFPTTPLGDTPFARVVLPP